MSSLGCIESEAVYCSENMTILTISLAKGAMEALSTRLLLLHYMLQFSNQHRSKITHDDCVQTQQFDDVSFAVTSFIELSYLLNNAFISLIMFLH